MNGKDGFVVEIGENGNWFIDGVDTGKPARGEKGETGATGPLVPSAPKVLSVLLVPKVLLVLPENLLLLVMEQVNLKKIIGISMMTLQING